MSVLRSRCIERGIISAKQLGFTMEQEETWEKQEVFNSPEGWAHKTRSMIEDLLERLSSREQHLDEKERWLETKRKDLAQLKEQVSF